MKYYDIREAFTEAMFKQESDRKVYKTAKKLLSLEKDAKVMDYTDVVDPMITRAKKEHGVTEINREVRDKLIQWFKTVWTPPNKR